MEAWQQGLWFLYPICIVLAYKRIVSANLTASALFWAVPFVAGNVLLWNDGRPALELTAAVVVSTAIYGAAVAIGAWAEDRFGETTK